MAIDGKTFGICCASAVRALGNKEKTINNLNVFPVPDGDTGTNMYHTMESAQALSCSDGKIGSAARLVSENLLRSARGNSGAILALYFRGFSQALSGLESASVRDIASALENGTKAAYNAVLKPTEGTMLTVMRLCGEKALELAPDFSGSDAAFFEQLCFAAENALAKTTDMLPVLKQAQVVDAGGLGFLTIIEGFLAALRGTPVEYERDPAFDGTRSADFSMFSTEDISFAYCVECIVKKSAAFLGEGTASPLLEKITPCGDSIVFIDTEDRIKIHIHTNTPSVVLDGAQIYGELDAVKVEDMRQQHTALAGGPQESALAAAPSKKYGFVAVCIGEGLETIFRDLGADNLVHGGQTMNPSTEDILRAVALTPADNVFILPGNKNIELVARQAAGLTGDRSAFVIPTKSIPQSIAAILAFDPDLSPEENSENMESAAEAIKSVSVTRAVKDADIESLHISRGQYMGLLDGKIICASDTPKGCFLAMGEAFTDAGFISVYFGEDVELPQAQEAARLIEELSPDAEVEVFNGGQPLYDYIISLDA